MNSTQDDESSKPGEVRLSAQLGPLPWPEVTALSDYFLSDGSQQSLAFTHDQMRAYARAAVAAERERHADALRCALEALDYCIEDSAELLNERTVQWGSYRKDRQAAMAATLERHRAVAERLRAMLRA